MKKFLDVSGGSVDVIIDADVDIHDIACIFNIHSSKIKIIIKDFMI